MKLNSFFGGAVTTLLVVTGAALIFKNCGSTPPQVITEETTTVEVDTIPQFIDAPIPKDSTVLRYVAVKVPVYDTIPTFAADTLKTDTATVRIPISQKVYEDTTYKAWVSGYMPSLDSIRIYRPTTTITHTVTNTEIRYKAKRWGLGVQVGMGMTPNRVEPYVGIGVTYNIFSW